MLKDGFYRSEFVLGRNNTALKKKLFYNSITLKKKYFKEFIMTII